MSPRTIAAASRALLLALLVGTGCTDEPPLPAYRGDGVCFPVAMKSDPAGRYLFVVGANFDRSFRGGITRVFDAQTNRYLADSAEVGSFASTLHVQTLAHGGKTKHRLLVASRDDDAVATIAVERDDKGAPTLACAGEKPAGCPEKCAKSASFGGDGADDLDIGKDPIELSLADDPAGKGTLVHVVGTSNGKVAIVRMDERDDGSVAVSAVDSTQHIPGVSSAVTSPLTGRTYVANSRQSYLVNYSVQASTIPNGADPNAEPTITYDVVAHAHIPLPSAGGGEYGRGMALSTDGSKLYLAYRNPNSLVVVDIAPGATGEPANKLLAVIGLGGSPAQITVAPTGPDGRDLVYVSCFGSDDIWIVDPQLRSVRGVVRLPHSPYALTVIRDNAGHFALYAALFSQHTIARVPLVAGLPPAGEPSGWLKLIKTTDCSGDSTPEEVRACN